MGGKMFLTSDILDDAEKIFRGCEESDIFNKIGDAVELLANKGEVDPLVGYVDLCVSGQCVTLPREVETVLAINLDGHPTIGRNPLFSFHLNGPGDFFTRCKSFTELGQFPTYRDMHCPSQLIAFLDNEEDNGSELWVFGYDWENKPLRTQINGVWRDGILIPTVLGYSLPETGAPVVARITAIRKSRTVGNVRLSSFENSSSTGTLLGIFEPDEVSPLYRRIKLGQCASWARIHYRKKTYRIYSTSDRILLHSRFALLLAMRAIQAYTDGDIQNALAYEANAVRLLTERESVLESPAMSPLQVDDHNSVKNDGCDDID
jgi:hypothetical protein